MIAKVVGPLVEFLHMPLTFNSLLNRRSQPEVRAGLQLGLADHLQRMHSFLEPSVLSSHFCSQTNKSVLQQKCFGGSNGGIVLGDSLPSQIWVLGPSRGMVLEANTAGNERG